MPVSEWSMACVSLHLCGEKMPVSEWSMACVSLHLCGEKRKRTHDSCHGHQG